jgi:hypothetical protein
MSTSNAGSQFWTEQEKYHELVKQFEQNIEVTHPKRAKGECSRICGRCTWAATTVNYPTYNGPRVTNL